MEFLDPKKKLKISLCANKERCRIALAKGASFRFRRLDFPKRKGWNISINSKGLKEYKGGIR